MRKLLRLIVVTLTLLAFVAAPLYAIAQDTPEKPVVGEKEKVKKAEKKEKAKKEEAKKKDNDKKKKTLPKKPVGEGC